MDGGGAGVVGTWSAVDVKVRDVGGKITKIIDAIWCK